LNSIAREPGRGSQLGSQHRVTLRLPPLLRKAGNARGRALPLLRECHRILRPGGLLMIGTGNRDSWRAQSQRARWEYLDISRHGGHISFFSPGSLRLAAVRAGFVPLRVTTRNVRLVDKSQGEGVDYFVRKLAGELLNLPARWLGKVMTYWRYWSVADESAPRRIRRRDRPSLG
jgi:SAM-dependent methyltransferase